MSLKAFHLVFVTASLAIALFFGGWAFMQYRESGSRLDLAYVSLSLVSIVVLVCYGRYFLKKLKHISYL